MLLVNCALASNHTSVQRRMQMMYCLVYRPKRKQTTVLTEKSTRDSMLSPKQRILKYQNIHQSRICHGAKRTSLDTAIAVSKVDLGIRVRSLRLTRFLSAISDRTSRANCLLPLQSPAYMCVSNANRKYQIDKANSPLVWPHYQVALNHV